MGQGLGSSNGGFERETEVLPPPPPMPPSGPAHTQFSGVADASPAPAQGEQTRDS